jgi:hypothetical protein
MKSFVYITFFLSIPFSFCFAKINCNEIEIIQSNAFCEFIENATNRLVEYSENKQEESMYALSEKAENCFLYSNSEDHLILNKSVNKKNVSTSDFAFQYTTDGWLQHVAIYSELIVCTNAEGPREGFQCIITNTGALVDICHTYKIHKEYVVHKYSWGEIRTSENIQTVIFNKKKG